MSSNTKPLGGWADIENYRKAYTLTAVASFGGMLFGWDTVSAETRDFIVDTQNADVIGRV